MAIWEWILIVVAWNIGGLAVCIPWACNKYADGWELCNPYYSYECHENVNWFGATMLSLLYTALCPIGAACYWFYKLCTVGRR
jgi:hypothetical protein